MVRLLVGFHLYFDIRDASTLLTRNSAVPDFQVTRESDFLHAVEVQVDRLAEVAFIREVRLFDPVAYVARDLPAQVASEYHRSAAKDGLNASGLASLLHGDVSDPDLDTRVSTSVRVGIVDTGMSQHPSLPAVSFTQLAHNCRLGSATWINSLLRMEGSADDPFSEHATRKKWSNYSAAVQTLEFEREKKATKTWLREVSDWIGTSGDQIVNQGRTFNDVYSDFPRLDPYSEWHDRIISHASRRFSSQGESLNVHDGHGHGTGMASLILGAPLIAEAVIFKSSSGIDVARALEECGQARADCDAVYLGLTFDPTSAVYQDMMGIKTAIEKLAAQKIPVICPIGNGGGSSRGLHLPAAMGGAVLISAVACDPAGQHVKLASYNSQPDESQSATFCAFGGDKGVPGGALRVAGQGAGFAFQEGTSLAAALSTRAVLSFLTKRKEKALATSYRLVAKNSLNLGSIQGKPSPGDYRLPTEDLVQSLPTKNIGSGALFGRGIIQMT